MFFLVVLVLTTLSIAGSAAFFSIYGLAQIFTGSFWPVVVMASSLEAGKLVSASFLYRYWSKIGFLMKTYLFTAIFILMVITSAGIFGFLSAAYQQDILPLEEMETQIEVYEGRKTEIDQSKVDLLAELARMDAQIDAIPGNHSTNRRRMRESQEADRERVRSELARLASEFQVITTEQGELRKQVLSQAVHTGPIIFIAEAFGREVDDATKWMILIIIFAFDPLAVILTIGANIAYVERRGGKDYLFFQGSKEKPKEEPKQNIQPTDEETTEHVGGSPQPEPLQSIVIHQGMDAAELQSILDKRFSENKKLSPEEEKAKLAIQEQLAMATAAVSEQQRRKQVTERLRKGDS